jgi:phosphatidyl-myo-inositol alpha-mannosyltransferase
MRIGLVSPYSLTLPGGVQGQVLGLARVLRARGHEARVLGPSDGPPPEPWVTPLGNSIPTVANGSMAPLAPDASAALRTIRVLREERFEVLHCHEPLAPGPTMTSLVMHPCPVVGTFHAAGDSASYKYMNRGSRWLADRLDRRCAVSGDARELAHRYLGGEYDVLFNGVELDRFRTGHVARAESPTIFFCGRHEPRKGLEQLREALALLPPDTQLWIASDGPETGRLRSRFAGDPRVTWLGRIPESEKIHRLRAAWVFCAPSLHGESFGVVLIEAMAAGTAIVATELAGYRAVARPGEDALLVPPDDVDALADALGRVLAEPGLRKALELSGSERCDRFSMETLAVHYEAIYRDVVARWAELQAPETIPRRRWRSR